MLFRSERIYVQDRLLQEGAELYRWIEEGAYLYVCGGISMEKAIVQALQSIAQTHGGLDQNAAAELIEDLRSQGRYLRDVY